MNPDYPDGVPRVGELIAGRYQVEGVVGGGGMGLILGARHVELGQRVAIKILRADVPRRAEVEARFLREARACARMHSEHVVRVFDIGRLESGSPFMVMEHLDGTDLGRFVELGGPIPVDDVIAYVLQACEAVAEAHALGIVHRDIKPSNIFLAARADGSPIVKLLDFGISKVSSPEGVGDLTATDATVGSPFFMSPEQVRASRDVDHRTDIWSLGVVLYQLLSGKFPFDAPTQSALCVIIATEAPTSIHEHRADVPSALEAVVMKCLEKDPARRFQNVGDLARALAPFAPAAAAPLVERITRITRKNALADTAPSVSMGDGGRRGRVLLVEDDSSLRHAYAKVLRRAGWSVDEAAQGHEAIARLGAITFDAIVSDIDMPGLDGVELLRAVRARADRTPVVLMTGGPSVSTAIQAVELGAFRYLVKPVPGEVIEEVVQLAFTMSKRGSSGRPSTSSSSRAALLHGMGGAFGKKEDIGLLDLVHLLSSAGKTGVLTIGADTDRAIHFLKGDVVDARCDGRAGEEAFFAIVLVADGTFRFDPTSKPTARVIDRTSESLLLEAMRRLEEGVRE